MQKNNVQTVLYHACLLLLFSYILCVIACVLIITRACGSMFGNTVYSSWSPKYTEDNKVIHYFQDACRQLHEYLT